MACDTVVQCFSPMEVNMEPDSIPDLSPERAYAHRVAAEELVKYWQEFGHWRKAKRGTAGAVPAHVKRMVAPPLTDKPVPHSSA